MNRSSPSTSSRSDPRTQGSSMTCMYNIRKLVNQVYNEHIYIYLARKSTKTILKKRELVVIMMDTEKIKN